MSKKQPPGKAKAPKRLFKIHAGVRLYTLEVGLISGYVTEEFVKDNPVVSRTIQIRGDQTLEELHDAIFTAFDRYDEHLFEFQLGKEPMDPNGESYGVGMPDTSLPFEHPSAGDVHDTTIDDLALSLGRVFYYWFDFGDDWWHRLHVTAIDTELPGGQFPRVIKRVGASPPQYPDLDDE